MRIKTPSGTILESSNELVIEQWKKQGREEVPTEMSEEPPKAPTTRRKKE